MFWLEKSEIEAGLPLLRLGRWASTPSLFFPYSPLSLPRASPYSEHRVATKVTVV